MSGKHGPRAIDGVREVDIRLVRGLSRLDEGIGKGSRLLAAQHHLGTGRGGPRDEAGAGSTLGNCLGLDVKGGAAATWVWGRGRVGECNDIAY